jgi:hypothetical protein
MSLDSEYTHFSRDTLGRWICNLFEEALASSSEKPFDVIVVGGGSFGAVFAQHMFERDRPTKSHRILVLEAGPFDLPEHVQNMALLGLGPPDPSRIADLRALGQDKTPRNEVWGLPWHSSTKFPGLAYSVGGRSAYFGGWSPRLLDAEMPLTPDARHSYPWPQAVVDDLKQRYFDEAAAQIGTDATNDFISGELHNALRRQLRDGITGGAVPEAVAFAELDLHVQLPPGTPASDSDLWKLEAPLAVQSASPRSGFFPFNKFSSIPLLIRAARLAQGESNGVDAKKTPHDGAELSRDETDYERWSRRRCPHGTRRRERSTRRPRRDMRGNHRKRPTRASFVRHVAQRWSSRPESHDASAFEYYDTHSARRAFELACCGQ